MPLPHTSLQETAITGRRLLRIYTVPHSGVRPLVLLFWDDASYSVVDEIPDPLTYQEAIEHLEPEDVTSCGIWTPDELIALQEEVRKQNAQRTRDADLRRLRQLLTQYGIPDDWKPSTV